MKDTVESHVYTYSPVSPGGKGFRIRESPVQKV